MDEADHDRALYYRLHCPYPALAWLAEGRGDALWKREFAVEGDYYKRYVEAKHAYALRTAALGVRGLSTLHIGPVCTGAVSLLRKGLAVPHRRELIFDLDLTDYDHLELTTRGASGDEVVDLAACDRAWGFAAIGLFILRHLLREHFGFEWFLVVYSGRRGAHLWVLDERAMALPDEARAAIAAFVNAELTSDKRRATSKMRKHAETYELVPVIEHAFDDLVVQRGYFDSFGNLEDFVDRLDLRHESLRDLADDAAAKGGGAATWNHVHRKVEQASLAARQPWMLERLTETMAAYVWPRIDFNVTKAVNHLIKCPYVAHGKTGRIAVPVDPDDYWRFDPSAAPTVGDLGPDWRRLIEIERYVVRDRPTLPMWRPRDKRGRSRPPHHRRAPPPAPSGLVPSDDEDAETLPDVEDLVPGPPPLQPQQLQQLRSPNSTDIGAACRKRDRGAPKPSPLGPNTAAEQE